MGKPLISDAQLLAIHAAMLDLRSLDQRPRPSPASASGGKPDRPIALLAATLLQLRPVDTLFVDGEDPLAAEVLTLAQEATFSPQAQATVIHGGNIAIEAAAGHALAQARSTRAGDDAPVTVALLRHAATASLAAGLQLASEYLLPLLVVLQDGPVQRSGSIASLPNVEVVRVDDGDAVACCRVTQESLLRTRNRWGSVVLQAVSLPNAVDPVAEIETHLRRRNLSPAV